MTQFDRTLRSQFFLTGPRPCPYLPDRYERKLFTSLAGPGGGALHDELSQHGFRRSQHIAYRPACPNCSACLSTRIDAEHHTPRRSERRVLRANADIVRRVRPAEALDEQYQLFARYLSARHAEGGMTDMDAHDYAAMVEDTPVETRLVEYRAGSEDNAPLVAVCLTDILADGLSLVYSFFDPDEERRSLGKYIILDHLMLCREMGLRYTYLGYWVAGSEKMDYKRRFSPAEVLTDHGWTSLDQD